MNNTTAPDKMASPATRSTVTGILYFPELKIYPPHRNATDTTMLITIGRLIISCQASVGSVAPRLAKPGLDVLEYKRLLKRVGLTL